MKSVGFFSVAIGTPFWMAALARSATPPLLSQSARVRDPPALGVDYEVPPASLGGGRGTASARSDSRHLRAARSEDSEGACVEGPRAPVRVDQSVAAMVERQDGASSFGGISASEEAVLGAALMGARIVPLQLAVLRRQNTGEAGHPA